MAMVSMTAKSGTIARPVEKKLMLSENETEASEGDIVLSSKLDILVSQSNGNCTA